ncbi:MAG: thymidine kinase [Planctomycetia bacterium]|nr:thymidine kinase [Planctomycetia bacterium]
MAQLYFYYSAMNAGKSTTLLQSAHNYHEQGMVTLLYTPAIDDRAGARRIHSRIGISSDAIAFGTDYDFFAAIDQRRQAGPLHCVLVDEAQFLSPRQVLQLTMVCDRLSIPVLCYGIRTDFRGEPFEGSKYLLAWADNIVEIKTICRSGKKATMNARLDAHGNRVTEGRQIDIGHHYEAMSRKEFRLDEVSPVGRPPVDRSPGETEPAESSPGERPPPGPCG